MITGLGSTSFHIHPTKCNILVKGELATFLEENVEILEEEAMFEFKFNDLFYQYIIQN